MDKKKKIHFFLIILTVLAVLGLLLVWGQAAAKREANQPKIILFYGETCPHCKLVEEFLTKNNVRRRLAFQELEVYNNKANASLLGEKAKECRLDTNNGVGVPFLFDGEKCLVGDTDIINYFQNYTQTK